MGIYSKCAN